jgi:hypothetical protein
LARRRSTNCPIITVEERSPESAHRTSDNSIGDRLIGRNEMETRQFSSRGDGVSSTVRLYAQFRAVLTRGFQGSQFPPSCRNFPARCNRTQRNVEFVPHEIDCLSYRKLHSVPLVEVIVCAKAGRRGCQRGHFQATLDVERLLRAEYDCAHPAGGIQRRRTFFKL